jgi:transcriptional regulator of acetoin/glycerol metabolism
MICRASAGGVVVVAASIASKEQRLETVREQAEREHILSILKLTGGHRVQAARILGVSRKTLWKKLKRLGVSWPPGSSQGRPD